MKQKIWNIYKVAFYFLPFVLFYATQQLSLSIDGREGGNGWLYSAVIMIFIWPLLCVLLAVLSPSKTRFDYMLLWVVPVSALVLFFIPYLQEVGSFTVKLQQFWSENFNQYILSLLFVLMLLSWLCSFRKFRVFKKRINA